MCVHLDFWVRNYIKYNVQSFPITITEFYTTPLKKKKGGGSISTLNWRHGAQRHFQTAISKEKWKTATPVKVSENTMSVSRAFSLWGLQSAADKPLKHNCYRGWESLHVFSLLWKRFHILPLVMLLLLAPKLNLSNVWTIDFAANSLAPTHPLTVQPPPNYSKGDLTGGALALWLHLLFLLPN